VFDGTYNNLFYFTKHFGMENIKFNDMVIVYLRIFVSISLLGLAVRNAIYITRIH
jgi:hypothetical protein